MGAVISTKAPSQNTALNPLPSEPSLALLAGATPIATAAEAGRMSSPSPPQAASSPRPLQHLQSTSQRSSMTLGRTAPLSPGQNSVLSIHSNPGSFGGFGPTPSTPGATASSPLRGSAVQEGGFGTGAPFAANMGDALLGGATPFTPQGALQAALQDLAEYVGVVHLALHPASMPPSQAKVMSTPAAAAAGGGGGAAASSSNAVAGLVVGWGSEVLAAVEPGESLYHCLS